MLLRTRLYWHLPLRKTEISLSCVSDMQRRWNSTLFRWRHLCVSTKNTIKMFFKLHKLQFATPSCKYERKKPARHCKVYKPTSGRLTSFPTLKLERFIGWDYLRLAVTQQHITDHHVVTSLYICRSYTRDSIFSLASLT
jgi:hypothetical protein